jgi:hypothetical protein
MVKVSADVTNPAVKPFIVGHHVQKNADGSVSIALDAAGSKWAGQEPNQYGVRHDSDGAPFTYQKFTRAGNLLISQTREQDDVFTYTIAEGVVYP